MDKGTVRVVCGPGCGKTASALGLGMMGMFHNKKVIVVQFLKGGLDETANEMLKRLEPEMKVFRFERSQGLFEDLSEDQKREELMNLKNGFNFARKVMVTGECDILILDEVFGLLDQKIVSMEELMGFLDSRTDEIDLILTGRVCPDQVLQAADLVSCVENIKVDNSCE